MSRYNLANNLLDTVTERDRPKILKGIWKIRLRDNAIRVVLKIEGILPLLLDSSQQPVINLCPKHQTKPYKPQQESHPEPGFYHFYKRLGQIEAH